MSNTHDFKFEVDINVINHLGVGLYSSTPAALTELVANAWDADAQEVTITIDPENGNITIEDDGHGMTADDIKSKFLKVGYSRRVNSKNKNKSESGKRSVMGRKGIGKLSMFALADFVKVSSQADGTGEAVGFLVDVPLLKQSIESNQVMTLEEFAPPLFPKGKGTRIELQKVLKGLKTTESHLRVKLARRFSVLGSEYGFKVTLNDREITLADRDFYDKVQFLWVFDEKTRDRISKLCSNLVSLPETDDGAPVPCIQKLTNTVILPPTNTHEDAPGQAPQALVRGYIASVQKPQNLGSKTDSANMLSIFANGRVFAENILNEANSGKYYQNYLVGEIHADFLDDDETDRATASREAIKRDDPKYQRLLAFAVDALETIGNQWDDWRLQMGLDPAQAGNAAVSEWLATLTDKRDLAIAKKLMTSIQNATVHSDELKNAESKALLYRGAIIGFEKLKLRKELDKLSSITDVLSAEFAAIFSVLNEVEEAAYAEITKQRLEIIKKFKDISDSPTALEKVAQTYLFDHLWLLDPSWDRVTGRKEMELTLTEYIKQKEPDSSGARLDISYRASSGRHVVVELKKPGLTSLNFDALSGQARKYRRAVQEYYKTKLPGQSEPGLDIYILVGKTPNGMDESDRKSLAEQGAKLITYYDLITNANNSYQEYLDAKSNASRLEQILQKI